MPITAAPGSNQADVMQMNIALQYATRSSTYNIYFSGANGVINMDHTTDGVTSPISSTTVWNPQSALAVQAPDGTWGIQSPALGLIHEMLHKFFGFSEEQATAIETMIAKELGEPIRKNYNSYDPNTIKVDNSTEHTENGKWVQYDMYGFKSVVGNYNGAHSGISAPSGGNGLGSGGGGGGGSSGAGGGSSDPIPGNDLDPPKNGHVEIKPASMPASPSVLEFKQGAPDIYHYSLAAESAPLASGTESQLHPDVLGSSMDVQLVGNLTVPSAPHF